MSGRILVATLAVVVLAGCTSDGSDGRVEEAAADGTVTMSRCEPKEPLVPADTAEVCGGDVLMSLFSLLIRFDPETGAPIPHVARSIESTDRTTWTVTIHDDWTFHDGTPVTASSFVDAWNWAASGLNATKNGYWFGPGYLDVAGYDEVMGADDDADGAIETHEVDATAMSGLVVVDDVTLQVQLNKPFFSFASALGYIAFAPVPESFFADPVAFGEAPVGNGPFAFERWTHDVEISVTASPTYAGPDRPTIGRLVYRVYGDQDAAYADLRAGNLDIMPALPPSALADRVYDDDLDGRVVEYTPGQVFFLTFPEYDDRFASRDLRRAISMAIDREQITLSIYSGGREPATSWASPVVPGYTAGTCGVACTYDPDAARSALEVAGGFAGPLVLSYNADGGHKEAMEAICIDVQEELALECVTRPYQTTSDYFAVAEADGMEGPFHTAWYMDYPELENFLAPTYVTGASSNLARYSNPELDALVAQGVSAEPDAAAAAFRQAEVVLARDLPSLPLWTARRVAGHSDRVTNVVFDPMSFLVLSRLELTGTS